MTLRLLTIADLPQAFGLSSSAGWNQTADGWRRLLDLAPETCFGIESDGSLAATATLLPYGKRLAWLGMVLTRRDYQRKGFARLLMTHTLDAAGLLGIETVKLDATDQGQPLYENLGFVAERFIERWTSNGICGAGGDAGGDAGSDDGLEVPIDSLADLDYEAFGADRMRLLKSLAGASASELAMTPDGFALWARGSAANYLGPCVARNPNAARRLIGRTLAQAAGPWVWDVLPDSAHALDLSRQFGFQPARKLVRMRLGRVLDEQPALVYAAAGFELG